MKFGVVYYPSGAHRECASAADARDCFEHAPQPSDQAVVLVLDHVEIERREQEETE